MRGEHGQPQALVEQVVFPVCHVCFLQCITRQAASANGLDASEAAALAALPLRLQGGATQLPSAVLGALPGDAGGLICISDLLSLVLS